MPAGQPASSPGSDPAAAMPWSSAAPGRWPAAGCRYSSRATRCSPNRCMRCARSVPPIPPARSSSPGSAAAGAMPWWHRTAATGGPPEADVTNKGGTLLSLNVARAAPVTINGRKVLTAIGKRAVQGERAVLPLGIEGDEQADLSVHGGLGKAVYAYPSEHYAFWKTVRAQAQVALWDEELPFGAMGENLTLQGVAENELWIGDVLRFPGCLLAVSEPRFPCFKFNAAMG